jgi:protein phosphatase
VTHDAIRVSVFGKSDLGRVRERNEDAFLIADLSTGHHDPRTIGPRGSLFVIADGMGGAAAGEVASAMATDLIFTHMRTVWGSDADASPARFAYRLHEAVELANTQIHRHAHYHPDVRGMGTTVTAVGVYGRDLYLTQVGDSRAYLVRHGEAIQLTKDQSLMQRLIDAGEITEEEAELSERRNIILQALGPDPRVKIDLTRQPLRQGDTLFVCSDGLSTLVKREELAQLAALHQDPYELCTELVDLANARGGLDNITVIAARFEGDLDAPTGTGDVGHETYDLPSIAVPPAPPPSMPAATERSPVPPAPANSVTPTSASRDLPDSTSPMLSRGWVVVIFVLSVLLILLVVNR